MRANQHDNPAASNERGSVAIWLAMASFVMIVSVGMAVDLTGQVHAQQRARDVAAQAARAAGQEINAAQAIRGDGINVAPTQAVQAAQTYLAAADVSGTVTIRDGNTLVVTTTDTYNTKFLSIIGLSSMTVTGKAEARLARVVGGVEQ